MSSNPSNIPTRSHKGNYAKSKFFEKDNDIDVYIEDTEVVISKVYKEILNRAIGNKYKITKVFPLKCRQKVIDECSVYKGKRKSVFIIDGDYYLMIGENEYNSEIDKLDNLFILDKYCIENYLIDKNSIIEFLNGEDIVNTKEDLEKKIDFDSWINKNIKLLDLFITNALIFKHLPFIPTIKYSIGKFKVYGTGLICEESIKRRIDFLNNILLTYLGKEIFKMEKEALFSKISSSPENFLKYISGKDYLLKLTDEYMKTITPNKTNHDRLKLKLALNCDTSYFEKIKDIV